MSGPLDQRSTDRPLRPAAVEFAAAVLVVGGFVSILGSIQTIAQLSSNGSPVDGLAPLTIGIGLGLMILGLLVRSGRAWLVAINVVAIVGFLELTSASIAGIVLGTLDVLVVLALAAERPWFQWRPPADAPGPPPASPPATLDQPLTPPTASPPTR